MTTNFFSYLAVAAGVFSLSGSAFAESPQQQTGTPFRVDCRYHNVENIPGLGQCYASATYTVQTPAVDGDERVEPVFTDVFFGVGCDALTIFNDRGRIHQETVGERISPITSAFPAVEIIPEDALTAEGTYESVLDIKQGRLEGKCYVHLDTNAQILPAE